MVSDMKLNGKSQMEGPFLSAFFQHTRTQLSMVVYTCNPSKRLRQNDPEFEASLSYVVGLYLKTKQNKTK
jgi:hypothetical protein